MPWDLHGKFKYVDSNFKSIFRRQKKIGPSRACSAKGEKRAKNDKKGKMFENLGKNVQNLKMF